MPMINTKLRVYEYLIAIALVKYQMSQFVPNRKTLSSGWMRCVNEYMPLFALNDKRPGNMILKSIPVNYYA